jgi:Na+/melibiose symporter-like transporter
MTGEKVRAGTRAVRFRRGAWALLVLTSSIWALTYFIRFAHGLTAITPVQAILAVLIVLLLVVYLLPPCMVPSVAQLDDHEHVKAVGDARAAMVQALGGAALVGTLYFTAISLQDSRDTQTALSTSISRDRSRTGSRAL